MENQDGNVVKRVKLILIKKKYHRSMHLYFHLTMMMLLISLTQKECHFVKLPEVTDEEHHVSDDHPIEIDSDSSAALSMTYDEFEATNPHKIDDALQDIVEGLKKAANGFEELRSLVPSISVTEIPKLLKTVPLPCIQPLTKPMVQAIKSLGEAKMIELAVQEEHKKGTTQVSIMSNYGLTCNQVYKAITGVPRPGGSQYEAM